MKFHFTLELPPTQWQRPVKTKWATFNPHQKKLNFVRQLLRSFWKENEPLEGALSVKLLFIMPIANSSTDRKKRELNNSFHMIDPDIDNLGKFYLDAMTGVICKDDCQFAHLEAAKIYGHRPRVELMLIELETLDVMDEAKSLLDAFETIEVLDGSKQPEPI